MHFEFWRCLEALGGMQIANLIISLTVGTVVSRQGHHLLGLPLLDAAGEVDADAAGAEVSAADVAGDRRHGDRCNS